jgi:hypothetical protein
MTRTLGYTPCLYITFSHFKANYLFEHFMSILINALTVSYFDYRYVDNQTTIYIN